MQLMRFYKILFFLSFTFTAVHLFASAADIDSIIIHGIGQSIQHQYDRAENAFNEIISRTPDHPQGYFFLAATLQSKMMDYETDTWEKEFFTLLDKTENLSKERIAAHAEDPWFHFYLGSACSYRAFYNGKKKNYVSAIGDAITGMASLKRAIQLDSTMYDVYFGMGSYKYWRSRLTRYFNWLPLLQDERKTGIEMVTLAALKGRYTRYAAINGLAWMLIDDGQVAEAQKWAKSGLEQYPKSRFFLWGAAKSHFSLNQYEKAREIYLAILRSVQEETLNNHYNEIICYFKIAQCDYHLSRFEDALKFCTYVYSVETTPKIREKLSEIFAQTDQLRKKIIKKM